MYMATASMTARQERQAAGWVQGTRVRRRFVMTGGLANLKRPVKDDAAGVDLPLPVSRSVALGDAHHRTGAQKPPRSCAPEARVEAAAAFKSPRSHVSSSCRRRINVSASGSEVLKSIIADPPDMPVLQRSPIAMIGAVGNMTDRPGRKSMPRRQIEGQAEFTVTHGTRSVPSLSAGLDPEDGECL